MTNQALFIYNSLTQKKEPFEALEPGKIGMYVCGMTVYDYCHVGHARVMVAFDVIARFFRYQGFDVMYVRNITDVDDKIFARAKENGEDYRQLTQRFIDAMHEDEARLGNIPPTREPRATEYMDEIIGMISRLMEKGVAYQGENGDVYFSIEKFARYGALSKRKIEDLLAGARVEVGEAKKNPLDFVLWKMAKPDEAFWSSPWGNGRPGWHIECSAMSTHCLGDTFDIHGGGPDLKFPHHENEIAQSEACTGHPFVRYWMHAGAVRVNKEKMSKSLGNFFTIREVLEKYPAEVVRFFLVNSHYRSQIDYSDDQLKEASASLSRLYQSLRGVSFDDEGPVSEKYCQRFEAAMRDDFNTPEALAALFELARELNKVRDAAVGEAQVLARTLKRLGGVLGLLQQDPETFFKGAKGDQGLSVAEIEALIQKRSEARARKDWAESDRIRDELKEKGVVLDDARSGTTWRRV